MSQPERVVLDGADAFTERAALELVLEAQASVKARGRFSLALSGGSTPKRLYQRLARERALPWDKMHFFFGDERWVPWDHKDSNYRMAREALFTQAPIPAANVHGFRTDLATPEEAAQDYERALRAFFQTPAGQWPRFDCVLLGLGPDGHTASLFPGTPALEEKTLWAMAQWVEKLSVHRLTLTPGVLNHANRLLVLVQGAEKAPALHQVLEEQGPVSEYPARLVKPFHGSVTWLLDSAAASQLHPREKGTG